LAKPTTPILRTQIRPFVKAATPVIRNLRPAAQNLSSATPNLSKTFVVLNHLFNELGYYPGGGQHGYLWWLAWGDHNARSVFGTQDANGDFRQLFVQASCASLAQIANNAPPLQQIAYNLTGILSTATLCPQQAAANRAAYERYIGQHPNLATQSAPTLQSLETGAAAQRIFYPKLPTN
jgi:phospholipid/cholesterol/gamma-HCH transport system substrate-binding protein